MRCIILTRERADGLKLQKTIHNLYPELSDVASFIKSDLYTLPEIVKDVWFIFSTWYMPEFTEEEIRTLFPSLKAIFYAAGTVKYFAGPFLKCGIKVFSSAKANGIPVAEFVASQIVLANKGYFQAQRVNKSILWRWSFNKARHFSENRPGNYGAKVGLIGCGSVGTEVVRLLKPYQLDIYIHDPYVTDEKCQNLGVKNVDLHTLFETCDVISNHLPDLPSTRGIINYELLNRLKDFSTFINTGRGEQVIENDLAKLLRERPSICALLDVSQHEPPFPWSPILRRKNLFLSPHIAGSIGNEIERMVDYVLKAYNDFNKNKPSDLEVTLEMLEITA